MTNEIECAFTAVCVKAVELKTAKSGKPFATFSAVIGEGETKKFVRVACFGETAEKAAAQLVIGGKAYCEGTLEPSIWQPPNGEARLNLNCAARRVEVMGQIGRNRPKRERQAQNGREDSSCQERPFDDDLSILTDRSMA